MAEVNVDAGLTEDDFDLAFEAATNLDEAPGDDDVITDDVVINATTDDDKTEKELQAEADAKKAAKKAEADVGDPGTDGDKGKTEEELQAEVDAKVQAEADAKVQAEVDAKLKADAEGKAKADLQTKLDTEKNEADAKVKADKLADEAVARETPTEDEQTVIEQAQKDFPEVFQSFAIQQRTLLAKIENLLTSKLGEASTQFEQRISPTEAAVSKTVDNAHKKAILDSHSDAFTILPDIEAWILTQPAFLQGSYNAVLDNGASDEVVEFITMFKDATETKQILTPEEVAAQEAEEAKEKADKKAKEKKLKAQEGIRGRRTGGRTAIDPDDFDGAFEKFAETA